MDSYGIFRAFFPEAYVYMDVYMDNKLKVVHVLILEGDLTWCAHEKLAEKASVSLLTSQRQEAAIRSCCSGPGIINTQTLIAPAFLQWWPRFKTLFFIAIVTQFGIYLGVLFTKEPHTGIKSSKGIPPINQTQFIERRKETLKICK